MNGDSEQDQDRDVLLYYPGIVDENRVLGEPVATDAPVRQATVPSNSPRLSLWYDGVFLNALEGPRTGLSETGWPFLASLE